LVHGDPTINNFILNDRKIIIFDWEYTRLSESSYDFAYLYLWAWEDHHWRKTLIDKALKKIESPDKFKLFFRVNLILIALYHLYQVIHQISAFTEHKTSKYQQLLQRAVDSKLISIEQATNDFEELLK
jgi:thiamine kinase-like enzyme